VELKFWFSGNKENKTINEDYLSIRSINNNSKRVEAKIEWAERMSHYWKKTHGTRISVMDFNEVAGRSKRMMKDVRLFSSQNKSDLT
jgi:hypothetical protein